MSGQEELKPRAKKSFRSSSARDVRSRLCGVRTHTERERRGLLGVKEFQRKNYISLRNSGACVDTIFVARVNLMNKQPMKEWADVRRESALGLWSEMGFTNEVKEGAGEATSASYLLDFMSFV